MAAYRRIGLCLPLKPAMEGDYIALTVMFWGIKSVSWNEPADLQCITARTAVTACM